MTTGFKVLIVGAGLGGLTLAQSLLRSGIAVEVFERDKSPWDRPQGYRLQLEADAKGAVGTTPWNGALSSYERHMLDYGFAVVRAAALTGQQRMAQNPLPV